MRLCLILALCLLAVPNTASARRAIDLIHVGTWDVFTWLTEGDRFAYCGAHPTQGNQSEMMVSIGCAGLLISVDFRGMPLAPGQIIPVAAHVDQQAWFGPLEAQVFGQPGNNTLLVRFGWDRAALEALRRGNQVTVIVQDRAADYSLAGSSAALTQLVQCGQRYLGRNLSNDPPTWREDPNTFNLVCAR